MLSRYRWYMLCSEQAKIMEALEKAKSVDKGSTNENIDLAIKLFEVAANGHNAYAERRLGALNAISYGKPGFDSAFNNAVGYFTMAIEDGDAAYSYEMAEALTEKLDDGQLLLNKPHKLALAAYNGSSYYRILLSVYYWKILNKPQRTLESLYNWALNGDYVSLFNLADVLFALDDEEYKKSPDNYCRFYQPTDWKDIASRYLKNEINNFYQILNETLIVHSEENITDIFDIMKELLVKHCNEAYLDESTVLKKVAGFYVKIINEANSYVRGIDK